MRISACCGEPHYAKGLCRNHYMRARIRKPRRTEGAKEYGPNKWAYHLRVAYDLTPEEYDLKVTAQAGRCAICHELPKGRLNVDHDHISGTIRGLLCSSCNTGLGHFQDMEARLEQAASYLRSWRVQSVSRAPGDDWLGSDPRQLELWCDVSDGSAGGGGSENGDSCDR